MIDIPKNWLEGHVNYIHISALLILLYWFISLLPFFAISPGLFERSSTLREHEVFILNNEYEKWGLVSILVTVSKMIDLSLLVLVSLII